MADFYAELAQRPGDPELALATAQRNALRSGAVGRAIGAGAFTVTTAAGR